MTVKQQKKKWNIPWNAIKWIVIIVTGISGLVYFAYNNIQAKNIQYAKNQERMNKLHLVKVNDAITKKYDIVCKDEIIKKDNYQVIKVDGTYRVIVGSDTKDLDKTFKIGKCEIIYVITKEVK